MKQACSTWKFLLVIAVASGVLTRTPICHRRRSTRKRRAHFETFPRQINLDAPTLASGTSIPILISQSLKCPSSCCSARAANPVYRKRCCPRRSPFKTSGLRDLGHSAPYLHTGRKDTLEDVIGFYIAVSNLARARQPRNGAPELQGMALTKEDIALLSTFLRALSEDYE
jgi:cytochrome c peroxidase